MAETCVSFLTYDPITQTYGRSVRVFSYEISDEAKTYYQQAMQRIQAATKALSGTITSEEIQELLSVLYSLDAWSQYTHVQSGQEYTNSSLTLPDMNDSSNTIKASTLGTMDRYMAEQVDMLIKTLRAAGCDPLQTVSSGGAITYGASLNSDSLEEIFYKLLNTQEHVYALDNVISSALSAVTKARLSSDTSTQSESVQQLIMIDYITTANALFYDEMAELKTAIDLNQTALAYLNSLQDLMNQKDPQHFVMALQHLNGVVSTTVAGPYSNFERDTFNQELSNIPKFTMTNIESYLKALSSGKTTSTAYGAFQLSTETITSMIQYYLKNSLNITTTLDTLDITNIPTPYDNDTNTTYPSFTKEQQLLVWKGFLISKNITENPSDASLQSDYATFMGNLASNGGVEKALDVRISSILANLQYLIDTTEGVVGSDGSSLQTALETIYKDFKTIQEDTSGNKSLLTWVTDYESGNIGLYQKNLNNAIVASQSLNDVKSEQLKNTMFIYEEFYKSATAMLSTMQQLLQKIAASISR